MPDAVSMPWEQLEAGLTALGVAGPYDDLVSVTIANQAMVVTRLSRADPIVVDDPHQHQPAAEAMRVREAVAAWWSSTAPARAADGRPLTGLTSHTTTFTGQPRRNAGLVVRCPTCGWRTGITGRAYSDPPPREPDRQFPPVTLLGWYLACGCYIAGTDHNLIVTSDHAEFTPTRAHHTP